MVDEIRESLLPHQPDTVLLQQSRMCFACKPLAAGSQPCSCEFSGAGRPKVTPHAVLPKNANGKTCSCATSANTQRQVMVSAGVSGVPSHAHRH